MHILNKRLKTLMQEKNLTIRDVAIATGITAQSVSNYRSGRTIPGPDFIISICKSYHITPNWLFGYDNEEISSNRSLLEDDLIDKLNRIQAELEITYENMDTAKQKIIDLTVENKKLKQSNS